MSAQVIGLLHPGQMGAAVGRLLRVAGHDVLWASSGRGGETRSRADRAGLTDAATTAAVARDSDVLLSICPPHAAGDVAREVAGFRGVYVDANAVAPTTVRDLAAVIEGGGGTVVDGGIIGGPPDPARPGATRFYLSGSRAPEIASLFEGTALETHVVGDDVGLASALKMCYAAWTKGTSALLLGIRAVARSEGVEDALADEWRRSQPNLLDRSAGAARAAHGKGWRWRGEMEEIAATFSAAGLPGGFHQAAAEIYARSPRPDTSDGHGADGYLDEIVAALLAGSGA